jgi:hypothetical protein
MPWGVALPQRDNIFSGRETFTVAEYHGANMPIGVV